MNRNFWKGFAAFILPTFPLGYFWHLTTFADTYAQLGMLRSDPLIPLGLTTMIVQGACFSWAYPRLFDTSRRAWLNSGMRAALGFGLIGWSFAVLAVAAKYKSASVSTFVALETVYTAVQFLVAGLLMALAHRRSN